MIRQLATKDIKSYLRAETNSVLLDVRTKEEWETIGKPKGEKIGLLNIYISGELKKSVDIFSAEDIKKANIFSRLLKSINFLVWGDV